MLSREEGKGAAIGGPERLRTSQRFLLIVGGRAFVLNLVPKRGIEEVCL